MPIYVYRCWGCKATWEATMRVDAPLPGCPICDKGPVEKQPTAPAVHFKGSGFTPKHYK
jgi:putative FmdB family regulatory protein